MGKMLIFISLLALGCTQLKREPARIVPGAESDIVEPRIDIPDVDGIPYFMGTDGGYDVFYLKEQNDMVIGFQFENKGSSKIIPISSKGSVQPFRNYSFDFPARARQEIILKVTDAPTELFSHYMESYIVFFPRNVLPAIEPMDDKLIVTLPTEEKIEFDRTTKEIISGVLEETAPIDLGPDRFKRKFASLNYTGSGVMIRVNKRGGDPRLGSQIAEIFQNGNVCKVPVAKLWAQTQKVNFLFPTDEMFNQFLKSNYKFELSI